MAERKFNICAFASTATLAINQGGGLLCDKDGNFFGVEIKKITQTDFDVQNSIDKYLGICLTSIDCHIFNLWLLDLYPAQYHYADAMGICVNTKDGLLTLWPWGSDNSRQLVLHFLSALPTLKSYLAPLKH